MLFDAFGKPVVAGKHAGPVEAPLAGEKEFAVFLVLGAPAPPAVKQAEQLFNSGLFSGRGG